MLTEQNVTFFAKKFSQNWGLMAFRGVLALIFGVLALMNPFVTVVVLAIVWGVYTLADGITAVLTGWRMHRSSHPCWPYMLFGIIGILAGLIAMLMPLFAAVMLLTCIGVWAIFAGVFQILAAIRLRRDIQGEWSLGLMGAVSLLFGAAILTQPEAGALACVWIIGVFSLVIGVMSLILAYKMFQYTKSGSTM